MKAIFFWSKALTEQIRAVDKSRLIQKRAGFARIARESARSEEPARNDHE